MVVNMHNACGELVRASMNAVLMDTRGGVGRDAVLAGPKNCPNGEPGPNCLRHKLGCATINCKFKFKCN